MLSRLPFLPALTRDAVVRKIAANAGIILSGNTMASFLNLISFTIMANRCGPQALAVFALAQNYSMILNDIFNVQTWESMVRYGTTERGDRSTISIIKTNLMFDFFSALVALGREVELVRVPAEGHVLPGDASPVHRRLTREVILEWFGRYLKPGA